MAIAGLIIGFVECLITVINFGYFLIDRYKKK